MKKDKIYNEAIEEIKNLVVSVKRQCEDFSEEYDYEKEWVFSEFKRELNKAFREEE